MNGELIGMAQSRSSPAKGGGLEIDGPRTTVDMHEMTGEFPRLLIFLMILGILCSLLSPPFFLHWLEQEKKLLVSDAAHLSIQFTTSNTTAAPSLAIHKN